VTRDYSKVRIDQNGICEPKLTNAVRYLIDLLVRMSPRIAGIRFQRSDRQNPDIQLPLLLNH